MIILEFLVGNIKSILLGIVAFIGVLVVRKHNNLIKENEELNLSSKEKDKIINIQQKVLDASEDIKSTDLDANLERLSDKTERAD